MPARLKALNGPLKGNTFALPEGEYPIGRDKENALLLAADAGASRWHCVIQERDGQFTLRDLDSHNRTYVNDVEVHERRLEHGDEVLIGRSLFVFLVDGQPPPRAVAPVDLDDVEGIPGATLTLQIERLPKLLDAMTADLGPPREAPDAKRSADAPFPPRPTPGIADTGTDRVLTRDAVGADHTTRVFTSMVRVCRAISSMHRLEQLQRSLLDVVFDAIGAGRAAILLCGGTGNEFASALHHTRDGGEVRSFRIPRAVIRRVLGDRLALCVNDVRRDNDMLQSQTIQLAGICSIMAVPILAAETVVGAIYVDASDPAIRFAEDDLRLLTGIADASAAPLANLLRAEELERENERLLVELAGQQPLVGSSERMRAVHRFIAKVAASDSTVLIAGASGTGKELVARAIHRNSSRSGKRFMAVNCAAVTETLLESEFFGHEKGAFTGAFAQKKGKLEEADGGTVFFDEIGELALPLQSKLLRVLQEREFERVGGTRPIHVDIRIIAATNRDLAQEVQRGAFRQDLYFRVNVVSLRMPDLRERREDIPLLATHFLEKHRKIRRMTGISAEAASCLMDYDWPGNVRELENVIERAIVLGTTAQILADDLPESLVESGVVASLSGAKFHETIREFKRELVTKALEQTEGRYVEAAKRLGLHPNNLHRLIKTLNLK